MDEEKERLVGVNIYIAFMARAIESEEEFEDILDSAGKNLVVVDFWAEWCGPCRAMTPAYNKFAKDSEFKKITFLKVDVDELVEFAERMEIECMPAFHFYRNGEKIDELVGASKDKLLESLRRHNK